MARNYAAGRGVVAPVSEGALEVEKVEKRFDGIHAIRASRSLG
jgi:hypothetical protein